MMVLNVHTGNHKTYKVRDGEKGVCVCVSGWGVGMEMILTYPLDCHHQNDPCIKMGSDENHFINCEGQSHTTVSTDHNF